MGSCSRSNRSRWNKYKGLIGIGEVWSRWHKAPAQHWVSLSPCQITTCRWITGFLVSQQQNINKTWLASESCATAFRSLYTAFLCQSEFQYIWWSILQMPARPQNIPRVCSKTSKSYLKGSSHSGSPKSYESFQVTRVSGDLSKCVLITSPGHWLDTFYIHILFISSFKLFNFALSFLDPTLAKHSLLFWLCPIVDETVRNFAKPKKSQNLHGWG